MNTAGTRRTVETPKGAALFMIGAVVLLWILEIIDQTILFFIDLDQFGIQARELDGLPGILFAPLLHAGFAHLVSNSLPLAVLGFLILVGSGGVQRLIGATAASVLGSGLFAWILTPAHTIIVGASGVVFGWLTYLIFRGVFARDWKSIIVSVIVVVVYGGVLWGVLPNQPGVSWQAHLGGAIAGGLAAYWMHRRAKRKVAMA